LEKPHWGINLLPFMNTKIRLELIKSLMRWSALAAMAF
jgi:hypothetical protein